MLNATIIIFTTAIFIGVMMVNLLTLSPDSFTFTRWCWIVIRDSCTTVFILALVYAIFVMVLAF